MSHTDDFAAEVKVEKRDDDGPKDSSFGNEQQQEIDSTTQRGRLSLQTPSFRQKILRECISCKLNTESEIPSFNLLVETEQHSRQFFSEAMTKTKFVQDEWIYGNKLGYIGRTFEYCSKCDTLQVHSLFSGKADQPFLKLNLGGYSPVILNNVTKTCESKGKETKCKLVAICSVPRASPAFAVLDQNGDTDSSSSKTENLKIHESNLGMSSYLFPNSVYSIGHNDAPTSASKTSFELYSHCNLDSYDREVLNINPTKISPDQDTIKSEPVGDYFRKNTESSISSARLTREYQVLKYELENCENSKGNDETPYNTHRGTDSVQPRAFEEFSGTKRNFEEKFENEQTVICKKPFPDDNTSKDDNELESKRNNSGSHYIEKFCPENSSYGGSSDIGKSVTSDKVSKNRENVNIGPGESSNFKKTNQMDTERILYHDPAHENQEERMKRCLVPKFIVDDSSSNGYTAGLEMLDPRAINPKRISQWSNQDVVSFFEKTDCVKYSEVFKDQEIDGKALLLLNENKLHNLLGLKIGPSMKIACHIQNLKNCLASDGHIAASDEYGNQ